MNPEAILFQEYNNSLMSDAAIRAMMGALVQDAEKETLDMEKSRPILFEMVNKDGIDNWAEPLRKGPGACSFE
jgi:hypothetical protein